jgi:hypothetical protein
MFSNSFTYFQKIAQLGTRAQDLVMMTVIPVTPGAFLRQVGAPAECLRVHASGAAIASASLSDTN